MHLAMLKHRRHALEESGHDSRTAGLTVVSSAAGADVMSERVAPHREVPHMVHLPIPSGRVPAVPRVPADADLHVKRYHGGGVEDERSSATLHASTGTPAALLAPLADAADRMNDLARDGSPGDHVILTITIRR
jgi:hypothetical protein